MLGKEIVARLNASRSFLRELVLELSGVPALEMQKVSVYGAWSFCCVYVDEKFLLTTTALHFV